MENDTKYKISTFMNDGIMEVTVTGRAAGRDFETMVSEVGAIVKAGQVTKVLLDVRGLDERINHAEIYRFVRNRPSFLYDMQAAIVDLPENAPYANAIKNAGLPWKWFPDMEPAKDFLNVKKQGHKIKIFDKP